MALWRARTSTHDKKSIQKVAFYGMQNFENIGKIYALRTSEPNVGLEYVGACVVFCTFMQN